MSFLLFAFSESGNQNKTPKDSFDDHECETLRLQSCSNLVSGHFCE